MRYSEFKKINENLDGILNAIMGKAGVDVAAFNKTETDKLAATEKPATPGTEKPATPEPKTSVKVSNGYTPKGATPEQMKQFGPSSKDKINWREMRSYIANKLSFNHAVAMVVNCKWESGWQPVVDCLCFTIVPLMAQDSLVQWPKPVEVLASGKLTGKDKLILPYLHA